MKAGMQPALNWASELGHMDIALMLLAARADANGRGVGRSIALQHAANGGHLAIVPHLLAAGAKINNQDKLGKHCLMSCARSVTRKIEMAKMLIDGTCKI